MLGPQMRRIKSSSPSCAPSQTVRPPSPRLSIPTARSRRLTQPRSRSRTGYLSLSRPRDAQRALLGAAKLADHLAATASPSPPATGAWTSTRDELAERWLALERGGEGERARELERRERVGRVAALVERAVGAAAGR